MTNTKVILPPEDATLGGMLAKTYEMKDVPHHLIKVMNYIDSIQEAEEFQPLGSQFPRRSLSRWRKDYQEIIDRTAGTLKHERLAIAMGHHRDYILAKASSERQEELMGCKEQLAKLHHSLTHPLSKVGYLR